MLSLDLTLRDMEDPLQGHPRYEKIRWASSSKDNVQIALDRQCNKTVAVKFFPRGSAISDYVRREILHHAELHHANVVALYHVFLTSKCIAPSCHTNHKRSTCVFSYLCVSLELGAQNLWQYVQTQGGRLPEDEVQSLFLQLLDGVEYCHSKRVANR